MANAAKSSRAPDKTLTENKMKTRRKRHLYYVLLVLELTRFCPSSLTEIWPQFSQQQVPAKLLLAIILTFVYGFWKKVIQVNKLTYTFYRFGIFDTSVQ